MCVCVARAKCECHDLCICRDLFLFCGALVFHECVCFVYVHMGLGWRSLIPGSVGTVPLRIQKHSSLIRPVRSSAISTKPSEFQEQRYRPNILFRLSFKVMFVLTHLYSSSQEISKGKEN